VQAGYGQTWVPFPGRMIDVGVLITELRDAHRRIIVRNVAAPVPPAYGCRDAMTTPSKGHAGPVLLYDGECGLCNRLVRGLLRLGRRGRLRFAPLQGPAAQAYLRSHGLPTEDFETLIYVPDWSQRGQPAHLVRTAGAIAALRATGGAGRMLAAIIAIFPTVWRDAVYRRVGRWRYRVFGKWRHRPLPRRDWAPRFLDLPGESRPTD
jgi:predicted DCC family thiol-disulfide oxidoreductase YuxK